MFNKETYTEHLNKISSAVPHEVADYFNSCFASAFAQGRENEISPNRIIQMMVKGIEQDLISYQEAHFLAGEYFEYFGFRPQK